MTTDVLARVVRGAGRREPAVERCELCRDPVPEVHRHVVDRRDDELLCACTACSLLFEREGAGRGRYRLVPERRLRLTGVTAAELGVPVGLAFFVPRPDGTVVARYPSPMGATRWDVEPATWQVALERCPPLRQMAPDVEALLVDTAHGADACWLVPIDDCYRLVAVVRREWRGLSGGTRVWQEVERFFEGLEAGAGRHHRAWVADR